MGVGKEQPSILTKLRKAPKKFVSKEQGQEAHREGAHSQVGHSQEGKKSQDKQQ